MFRPYAAFPRPSTELLLQKVYVYERNIISGTATPDDINDYVECQLELIERLPFDETTDPRD